MEFDLDGIPEGMQNLGSGCAGVYAIKCRLTKNSKAVNDLVIIEIVKQDSGRLQRGGIFLPGAHTTNCDMLKGKVIDVGPTAKKYNVKIDDIVLYDKSSAYYMPPEAAGTLIITHVENIICVYNNENNEG